MWTFVSIAESRRFRRWASHIEQEVCRRSLPSKDGLILQAILLVEMSQRPIIWRAVERALDLLQACLRLNRRLTLGPFQMRHASFRPSAQVKQAIELLTSMPQSSEDALVSDLARFWNGSSVRQPGSSMSYADALRLAIKVLSVSHPRKHRAIPKTAREIPALSPYVMHDIAGV